MPEHKPLDFTGEGFSEEDFKPQERAEMREMQRHYREHFIDVSDLFELAPLRDVATIYKHRKLILGTLATLVAFGVAVAWAVERRLFQ